MADLPVDTVLLHRWLERMRAGDTVARDELLRALCDRLERLARSMLRRYPRVRRWEETGDVLQNATLRLLRALQDIQPTSMRAFFGLAAEQMRRELLDLAKRHYGPHGLGTRCAASLTPADGAPSASADVADPTDDPEDLEQWCLFHERVAQLPTEEREVVGLIFYHGWSQAQVAELFGVDERTVRRRWKAGLTVLQGMFGDSSA